MKVVFDTNVVLDVLLDREPFAEQAAYLMSKVERSEISGFLCATTITTVYYLLSKYLAKKKAKTGIKSLMALFEIAPVNRLVIENALESKFSDFEDAVLHESARQAGVEYIITRNIRDFKATKIPAFSPGEFLSILEALS